MRTLALAGLILLGIGLTSCTTGSGPTAPTAQAPVTVPSMKETVDGATLLAPFRVAVDPTTLTATVTPHRTASAQPPQGQRYDLDIANFQNADSLRITGVQVLGSGNFRLTFSHAHPFPAPNVANPATGVNRADLGYTGRLVVLTQFNPQSYFANAVRLSAGAVVAPDGYVETGDLLANQGLAFVTAYPYMLLADEAKDNRVGVSNGSTPEGNYSSALGGWQRANLGASGDGWTGFDYVHGGQTVSNTLTLAQDALAASNFSLDVALLIQYTDPRGHGGAVDRLPPATANVNDFAYRLPYAALDCSRVTFTANLSLTTAAANSATLEVRVRDWDAGADEAADATVGDESDVALVQNGASGNPEVVLDAPGILSGLRNMGTPTGSGLSNDLLVYSNAVVNQEDPAPGQYYACLRVVDPEFSDTDRGTYHAGVDATTLIPSSSRAIPARTWQVVPITVTPAPTPPVVTGVNPTGIVGSVDEQRSFTATISGDFDSVLWEFAQGSVRSVESNGAEALVHFAGTAGTYAGQVTAFNAAGSSAPFDFEYRLLPPARPQFHRSDLGFSSLLQMVTEDQIIMLINDRPAVFRTVANGQPSLTDLIVSQALVPEPTGSGDWEEYIIDTGIVGALSVAEVAGRPALAAGTNDMDQVGVYYYATTATPADITDWVRTEYVAPAMGEDWARVSSLVDFGGAPAVLTREVSVNALYLFRSTTAMPVNPASWARFLLDSGMEAFDLAVVEFNEGLRLVPVMVDLDTFELEVWSASVPLPINAMDFYRTTTMMQSAPGFAISALGAESTLPVPLAIAMSGDTTGVRYVACQGATAMDLDVARNYPIPNTIGNLFVNYNVDLVLHNGRFAILHPDIVTGEYVVLRALTADPLSSDWDRAALPSQQLYARQGLLSYGERLLAVTDEGPVGGWAIYRADGPW